MLIASKTIFVFLVSLKFVLCVNILIISPLCSPSHHLWNKALSLGLVEKGHNITMLSHDGELKPTANFTVITMEGIYEVIRTNFNMEESLQKGPLITIIESNDFAKFVCEYDLNTTGLKTLLNYPEDFKFDLIIFDVTIDLCLYPIISRFNNPPVVAVTAFLLPPIVSNSFGNHLYTSYMPYYSTGYTNDMSLRERISNFIYTYTDIIIREYITIPAILELVKQRFGEISHPLEIERNISLLLTNTDPVLNYPIALPPNFIPVGGLHIKAPGTLPTDLQKIIDGAKHGVILFCLGTNIRSDKLTAEQRQPFLDAFSKLPHTILWKFESEDLEGLPKNVIIKKWLPQNDILGHPNVKLFISHGGALSSQEAMYHGVPVVGVPFFGDQHINIGLMKKRGLAEYINLLEKPSAEDIYDVIQKVLTSHMYRDNMLRISKLYRDQPQTAMQRAVFWIEYILRHGNVEHLVLPARDMPGYQIANLDVLAIAVFSLILIYYVFSLLFFGCRYVFLIRHYRSNIKVTK